MEDDGGQEPSQNDNKKQGSARGPPAIQYHLRVGREQIRYAQYPTQQAHLPKNSLQYVSFFGKCYHCKYSAHSQVLPAAAGQRCKQYGQRERVLDAGTALAHRRDTALPPAKPQPQPQPTRRPRARTKMPIHTRPRCAAAVPPSRRARRAFGESSTPLFQLRMARVLGPQRAARMHGHLCKAPQGAAGEDGFAPATGVPARGVPATASLSSSV